MLSFNSQTVANSTKRLSICGAYKNGAAEEEAMQEKKTIIWLLLSLPIIGSGLYS